MPPAPRPPDSEARNTFAWQYQNPLIQDAPRGLKTRPTHQRWLAATNPRDGQGALGLGGGPGDTPRA